MINPAGSFFTKPLYVAIVGAGLGGLCLAQGLKKRGIRFDVFERDHAADSRTQGYRIRIDHAGQSALRACLSDADYELFLRTCALPVAGMNVLDVQMGDITNRWIKAWRRSTSDADADAGDADRSAHRQTMREVLMQGIEQHVHFGSAFSHYKESEDGVAVHFSDDRTVVADVLVGADGVHSAVRRKRLPGHDPVDMDSVCIYGKTYPNSATGTECFATLQNKTSIIFAGGMSVIIDAMLFDPFAFESTGDGTRLNRIENYMYWAIIGTRTAFGLSSEQPLAFKPNELTALIERATEHWSPQLRGLFEQGDASSMAMAAIYSARSLPAWETSRVTLLGDAIHAMSPAGGLGANTALRDASLLAECLSNGGVGESSLPSRLGHYEATMRTYGADTLQSSVRSARALFERTEESLNQ